MVEEIRRLMARLLRNPHYKLLSVAMAVAAWLYVQSEEVHVAQVRAAVEWSLPNQLMSAEQLPTHVSVKVRGTRSATRRAQETAVQLPVDVTASSVGEHSLAFDTFSLTGMPPGVEVLGFSPSTVRFTLDEIEERKVALKPTFVGDPAPGYTVESVTFTPQVVEVRGPRDAVSSLREVTIKPIDLSGRSDDYELDVELDLPRSVGAEGDVRVRAAVVLSAQEAHKVLGAVPVFVWQPRDGWAPVEDAVAVTLEGPTAALRGIGPQDVVAFVHLPDVAERDRYEAHFGPADGVRLRILHPGGEPIRVVKVSPSVVQVERR